MSIQFGRAYIVGEKTFATLRAAQEEEIQQLFDRESNPGHWTPDDIASRILDKSDAVVSILTLNDSSRPGARGKSKPRKAKAQPELPFPAKDNT